MSKYVTVDGHSYYSPCGECRDGYCSSCLLQKYREDFEKERDKRSSAEFRIENELEPRIKAEERAYDRWVTTDRYLEWEDALDYRINEVIDMFDEDLDFSVFDFDRDDIVSKVAKVIQSEVLNNEKIHKRNI